MIYSASLNALVKKSFKKEAYQTSAGKLVKSITIDPKISNMDVVVLSPKDFGLFSKGLKEALREKHEDILVIYFYTNDKEDIFIDEEGYDIKKIKVKKINLETVEENIKHAISNKVIVPIERDFKSSDLREDFTEELNIIEEVREEIASATQSIETRVEPKEVIEEPVKQLSIKEETSMEETIEMKAVSKTLEQRVSECNEFSDWDLFKKTLEQDIVVRELVHENSQYAGTINMLEVLDRRISSVFKDSSLTAEDKFSQIRELGLSRSAYQDIKNNIIVDKVDSIIKAIIISTEKTVENRLDQFRKTLDSVADKTYYHKDRKELDLLVRDRLELQVSIRELNMELINLYKIMDSSVSQLISKFEENLPSTNPYINETTKLLGNIFTPRNSAVLANKLMIGLQEGRVKFSTLENKLTSFIELIFRLCDKDAEIISQQQKLIELLSANRVEDVVIVDTVLKNSLRLYVGADDTGRTSTVLTWAGILSRRNNTLVIDLTGKSKLKEYGVERISLDDFLNERIEKKLVFVEGYIEGSDKVYNLINELQSRLNYYPHINIILSTEQRELLNELSSNALSVMFISDCTTRSLNSLNKTLEFYNHSNIARKLALIGCTIPLEIINSLNLDPLTTKLINIPFLPQMRVASLKSLPPYENSEVVDVYEEIFK